MELDRKNVRTILLIITFTVVLYVAAQNMNIVFGKLTDFVGNFSQIIAGFCLAFVLNIVMTTLERDILCGMAYSKKLYVRKLQRPVSITITLIITIGIVAFLFLVVIPDMIELFTGLADSFPTFANNVMAWAEQKLQQFNIAVDVLPEYTIDWDKFFDTISDFLTRTSGDLVGGAVNVTTSIFTAVSNVVLSLIVAVFVLARKERVLEFFRDLTNALLPAAVTEKLSRVTTMCYEAFSNFVSSQLIKAICTGIFCYIGMLIFRMPNASIISIIIALTAIVPMVGNIVGTLTGTVILLVTNPWKALLFFIFIVALQIAGSFFIFPKFIGKKSDLPAIVVLCSVLIGGNMGGLIGTVMAVPAATVLYTLLLDLIGKKPVQRFSEFRKRRKPADEKKPENEPEKKAAQ